MRLVSMHFVYYSEELFQLDDKFNRNHFLQANVNTDMESVMKRLNQLEHQLEHVRIHSKYVLTHSRVN